MKSTIEPVFHTFEGWKSKSTDFTNYDQLPEEMKFYMQHITNFTGVPVNFISNGPGRDQIITKS
jgi:adenylosuccinate synthase